MKYEVNCKNNEKMKCCLRGTEKTAYFSQIKKGMALHESEYSSF